MSTNRPEGQERIKAGHASNADGSPTRHATGPERKLSSSPEQILRLKEGQEVPDSIRRNAAIRFHTIVEMPDGTHMSVEEWESDYAMPTTEATAITVMQHFVRTLERELISRKELRPAVLEQGIQHLRKTMENLGVHTDGLSGDALHDARLLVIRAKDYLERHTSGLPFPDAAPTTRSA